MIILELSDLKTNEPEQVRISKVSDNRTDYFFTENKKFFVDINKDLTFVLDRMKHQTIINESK